MDRIVDVPGNREHRDALARDLGVPAKLDVAGVLPPARSALSDPRVDDFREEENSSKASEIEHVVPLPDTPHGQEAEAIPAPCRPVELPGGQEICESRVG